ncbi:hypothetical protein TWF481_009171 [Arthrobotrys musiformis]|uniref:H-type lectin domain-containing protein n=1 Tax=Arthrobotrys musiformis TaxID=47236 RepID=A0AAV9W2Z4_9PEZI
MPSRSSGKQPMSNGSSWNGESSSSGGGGATQEGPRDRNSKIDAILAAAPRLSLLDDESLQPPSYDDANSIRSGFLPAKSSSLQDDIGVGVQDAIEFEYAFQVAQSHAELATSVVRRPGSKTTVLAIQRLALGSHKPNLQAATTFKLTAVPLAANQLELTARASAEMSMRSIQIGMLDIAEDDPDIQCGMIDWSERGLGSATGSGTDLPPVFFERSYPLPPDILMFLNTFSFKGNSSRRVRASTVGIGQQGFNARFITGPGSILDAKAAWVAIPKDSLRFDCGVFEITSKPSSSVATGSVNFTKWKFPKKQPPNVFIGLSGFDRDLSRPFRHSVAVTGKSHEGFSWTVRNWDESTISLSWGAVISWIAIANPINAA